MRMQATLLLATALQTTALVTPARRRPRACILQSSPSDRFGSLPKAQQYEALLLAALSGQQRDIDIALQLIEEMAQTNVGKVPAKVVGALVNAAVATKNARKVDDVLTVAKRSGGARSYGSAAGSPRLPPSSPQAFQSSLQSCPELPTDDRATETAAALAALACVGFPALAEVAASITGGDAPGPATFTLVADAAAFGADAYLLGGEIAKKAGAGVDRLLARDARREAECEAASFDLGYRLGLPCFAFSPTAVEAANAAVVDGSVDENRVRALLVWLCAPVACERRKHRKLLASDPRQAVAFLTLLRGRGQFTDVNSNEDNARWALGDAARLLESRTRSVEELADFFESGVATAGDVVARLER